MGTTGSTGSKSAGVSWRRRSSIFVAVLAAASLSAPFAGSAAPIDTTEAPEATSLAAPSKVIGPITMSRGSTWL